MLKRILLVMVVASCAPTPEPEYKVETMEAPVVMTEEAARIDCSESAVVGDGIGGTGCPALE